MVKKIALMCFVMLAWLNVCSCSDEDESAGKRENSKKLGLIDKVTFVSNDEEIPTGGFQVEYDDQNRVTKFSRYSFVYNDDDNQIDIRMTGFDTPLNLTALFDENNLPYEVINGTSSKHSYTYDMNKRLIGDTYFVKKNGKFVIQFVNTYTWEGDNFMGIGQYTYTTFPCKGNIELFFSEEYLYFMAFLNYGHGKSLFKYLPKGSETNSSDDINYEYKFDEEGYVTKIKEIYIRAPRYNKTYIITWK